MSSFGNKALGCACWIIHAWNLSWQWLLCKSCPDNYDVKQCVTTLRSYHQHFNYSNWSHIIPYTILSYHVTSISFMHCKHAKHTYSDIVNLEITLKFHIITSTQVLIISPTYLITNDNNKQNDKIKHTQELATTRYINSHHQILKNIFYKQIPHINCNHTKSILTSKPYLF